MSRLALLVLIFILLPSPGLAELLQGGVSDLAEALPPVQPSLRAGANFNEANLPAMGTVLGWYWIPAWAAGIWHRQTMTYDLPDGSRKTQLSSVDHFWGQQVDNRSGIWNHHNEPYGEREEMPGIIEWKTVVMKEPVVVSNEGMKVHFRATTVQVERASGRIRRSYQQEEMQNLRPAGPSMMAQESWIKFFDQMGRPLGNEHAVAQLTLSQPFVPENVDRKTGLNLQQDFRAFLAANNLQYLMPGEGGYPPAQAGGMGGVLYGGHPAMQPAMQPAAQPAWQPQMLPPPQQQLQPYSGGQYTR
jgi:hypothetical protein